MMETIYQASLDGEITKEDALKLVNSNHFQLFDVADRLRQEIVGDEVTFVANCNTFITDHCMIGCAFCSFRDHIGYEMTTEEILQNINEAVNVGASEICLFGGVMPYMDVEFYCDLFSTIKEHYTIDLHTLSPVEIYHAAEASNMTVKETLSALNRAGLDTLTGASAEILVDSVREKICPNKVSTQEWVDIIKQAHQLGIPTTSTIMYGSIETWEDRIDHLLILRDIQRETGGFTELVPMTFLGENNPMGEQSIGASGLDDLKLHAIARVILGRDIPNIQASWIKIGTRLAQVALCCGANDLGGTMMEDKISIAAGSSHGEYLTRNQMHGLIKGIGRVPVERNTIYEPVSSE
ncbi:5-amino-6-(D-ribitylamino)uracil--L-tyrosine 4-hydroxyphenyl transferase CofH [Methanobacterium petrolearium]|uniref:5-amino-6-(D-ribitylamino)uracil--L-tyrosine 4-hydroxyphenyl transferase CofH n=1 Tax=Methanobacterium petrolearium TaxID=710190 RepID=UPI001AE42294|nr:5-amino-6-(D-ribitylamino)uracil--L-tyrosine 4-hydroxyphenyl transferase CofH [Methanobacterium petrolearium]MBP1946278.1 FO synthase subunit 2 [Methanobacterium petrolearium]BDZ71372.1 7,8-didemethyl-8-hydroxy-5-deazariboflavin synthase subunit CofH [Methanobacterium petrolearium]